MLHVLSMIPVPSNYCMKPFQISCNILITRWVWNTRTDTQTEILYCISWLHTCAFIKTTDNKKKGKNSIITVKAINRGTLKAGKFQELEQQTSDCASVSFYWKWVPTRLKSLVSNFISVQGWFCNTTWFTEGLLFWANGFERLTQWTFDRPEDPWIHTFLALKEGRMMKDSLVQY